MLNKLNVPRLRMFAGPNGSGKSTMKTVLRPELLGVYVNADDIERTIKKEASLCLSEFDIQSTKKEVLDFFNQSTLLQNADLTDEIAMIGFFKNCITFGNVSINSYWASVTADFIRHELLKQRKSFTFETVMSSPDKVHFLAKAKELGYKTYLYYVATEDPNINMARVQNRVQHGGHDVPKDKIISRYKRSLDLLADAIKCTNRAYLFDNSEENLIWVAEITNGKSLAFKTPTPPLWLQENVINKF